MKVIGHDSDTDTFILSASRKDMYIMTPWTRQSEWSLGEKIDLTKIEKELARAKILRSIDTDALKLLIAAVEDEVDDTDDEKIEEDPEPIYDLNDEPEYSGEPWNDSIRVTKMPTSKLLTKIAEDIEDQRSFF